MRWRAAPPLTRQLSLQQLTPLTSDLLHDLRVLLEVRVGQLGQRGQDEVHHGGQCVGHVTVWGEHGDGLCIQTLGIQRCPNHVNQVKKKLITGSLVNELSIHRGKTLTIESIEIENDFFSHPINQKQELHIAGGNQQTEMINNDNILPT